jgi:hypothetical protein
MNTQKLKLPSLILAVGMLLAVVACLFTCVVKEPVTQAHDFEYAVTYKLDGEEKTLEGVYKCSFLGSDMNDLSNVRVYDGVHVQNGIEMRERSFVVAQKDGYELHVAIMLDQVYLMGDSDPYILEPGNEDPYLFAYDAEGYSVEVSDVFDAEIVRWDYPEPIENSFKPVGLSYMHGGSMLIMILVGVLTIIACAIFAKKDQDVEYKWLDKLSTVFNFIIGFVVVPISVLFIWVLQLVESEAALMYQVYLCTPAITVFTIAASIALRRKGFKKSGMIVQLLCPVLFIAHVILDALMYNFF